MKTKWIWAAIVLLLTSCAQVKDAANPSLTGPDSNKMDRLDYNITEADYTSGNMSIKYPQITGLDDAGRQNKINELIRNESLKVLHYYTDPGNQGIPDNLDLDITYQIALKDANRLSIQYAGLGDVAGAAHPNNLFYTTNIDLANGTKLRLNDVVVIDEHFIDKLWNGQFTVPEHTAASKSDIVDALKMWSKSELLQQFNHSDSLDEIGTASQSDIFSYFTKDSVGISIPVSHALGDHAEFEIKYSDLELKK
ncbi:polysaccharide deacetylase family protein [Paenibacillus kobensis]|uniref:hypothetical protein n=1 Tax=Paenibacillus kobensis TaxID=59841 RepID=UPI000FDB80F0|nr:hypothetical protein [Paenibacillus kobensis]